MLPPPATDPKDAQPAKPDKIDIYAEDWWTLSRPVIEIHGYYRVRAEFFNSLSLGRRDATFRDGDVDIPPIYPQPPDNDYIDTNGKRHTVALCGDNPQDKEPCDTATQAGANMRLRFSPELYISDNLRVVSQIDLLDNVVLGSTPQGYANQPTSGTGYEVVARGGYSPTSAFVTTQWAPVGGFNSTRDAVTVKRVWGEYSTPIGQLSFGRMPSHWGLGMVENAGDGFDSDWQTTVDRLKVVTGLRSIDLYASAAWDFANEGATSAQGFEQEGQPYDLAQKDDVDQWTFYVVRQRQKQLQRSELARGLPVFNGGVHFVYREQSLANDQSGGSNDATLGATADNIADGYLRRGYWAAVPDVWVQFLFKKFRFEVEAALAWGELENIETKAGTVGTNESYEIRQFGIATQSEFRAFEDKLRINFDFGYATGDADVDSLVPLGQRLQPQLTSDRTYSTFRFHPDYRVDLVLFRNVLSRVQGAYYFKPAVSYDFLRDPDGRRAGGTAGLIWSRASEFVQTPGHAQDLGVELNFKLYFQSRDGVINDDLEKMGGFYTHLEYGVLFPLDGMGYLQGEIEDYAIATGGDQLDTDTAHHLRWFVGVLF